ncbi:MAG: FISUMP domain-containing protein [Lentimicrobiaceae bacterium]|jgi:uncharacterized protein (TIGR02145 family)
MKKNYSWALFAAVLMFFGTLQTFAQVYTISFTGSGESATVESVEAQNVTQGISTTVPSGDVLVLNVTTALKPLSAYNDGIQITSNSTAGTSTVSFYAKQAGNARISVYSMDGRKIASLSQNLQKGTNSFQVSLRTGAYVIGVQGAGYALSGKMISVSSNNSHPEISFVGVQEKNIVSPLKSAEASVSLAYTPGDIMLYKGISGNYATIVTDVPTDSKTVNFNFIECKDASGNYYATVKIGGQIWMAECLRTTKYSSGASIDNVTTPEAWILLTTGAWCDLDNNTDNAARFGKLYNWFAVNDVRNICPAGWHVPTIEEYGTLSEFLGVDEAGNKLRETGVVNWAPETNADATNETGFSARAGAKCNSSGVFNDYNYNYLWTATELATDATKGTCAFLTGESPILDMTYSTSKRNGFSLRCILDDHTIKSIAFHATWQTDIEEWDFTYDISGKVAQMVDLWAGSVDKTLTYDYSVPNKLTLTKDDNSVYASYDLNASGYITKDDQGGGDYFGYEYNADGFGISYNEFFSGTNTKKREVFITDGNVSKIVKYSDSGDTTQIKVFTYLADNNAEGIFQSNISDSDWRPYGNLYGRPSAKLIDSYTYWDPTATPIVKKTATFVYTRDANNRITKIVKTNAVDSSTEEWDYTY